MRQMGGGMGGGAGGGPGNIFKVGKAKPTIVKVRERQTADVYIYVHAQTDEFVYICSYTNTHRDSQTSCLIDLCVCVYVCLSPLAIRASCVENILKKPQ